MATLAPRAAQVAVPDDPLLERTDHGYADAFEIRLSGGDPRTAEDFVRSGLDGAPRVVRWLILKVHRHLLRFRLGPRASSSHIMGWRVVVSEPQVVLLAAGGPLVDAVIVGRRTTATTVRIVTCVYYNHPAAKQLMESVVAPLHRRVARLLMDRAVARTPISAESRR